MDCLGQVVAMEEEVLGLRTEIWAPCAIKAVTGPQVLPARASLPQETDTPLHKWSPSPHTFFYPAPLSGICISYMCW